MINPTHFPLKIRPSKPEDLERILEIQSSALRTSVATYNSTQIESLVRGQASARLITNEVVLVAEYENVIVGFASLLIRKAQVCGVYVHPDFMYKGIGKQLLKSLEELAVDRGDEVAYVISSSDTVSFYEKSGYQLVRELGFYSEGEIWIPCKQLVKQLIVFTEAEKWNRLSTKLISSLRSFVLFILSEFMITFMVGLILFMAISFLASFFR
jgi:putative acetyltransferase